MKLFHQLASLPLDIFCEMEFVVVVFFLSSKKRLVGQVFPMVVNVCRKDHEHWDASSPAEAQDKMQLTSSNLGSRKENKLNQII